MNNADRFSNRVENYIKYRPNYPKELVTYLTNLGVLEANKVIADIGSGTGISAKLFLDHNCNVYGIEPNTEMREAGEKFLMAYPKFQSVEGSAENTSLENHTVDAIIAAQAFHWFDKEKCKIEFKRIVKPGGYILLIWNERITDSSDFLKAYEQLLVEYAIDYKEVNHKNIDVGQIEDFFSAFKSAYKTEKSTFKNYQIFDYAGLEGRLLSSSYVPEKDHPSYETMLGMLKRIFNLYNEDGKVCIEYDTLVYAFKVEG
jgi:SAM-dependent methyltransferase